MAGFQPDCLIFLSTEACPKTTGLLLITGGQSNRVKLWFFLPLRQSGVILLKPTVLGLSLELKCDHAERPSLALLICSEHHPSCCWCGLLWYSSWKRWCVISLDATQSPALDKSLFAIRVSTLSCSAQRDCCYWGQLWNCRCCKPKSLWSELEKMQYCKTRHLNIQIFAGCLMYCLS